MRVIRYTLIYLLLFASVAIIGVLGAQRILLYLGKQQLISAVTQLVSYSKQSTYVSQCRQINREFGQESTTTSFQLRFEDDQSYVIESVCLALPDRPIVITRGTLPKYVSKLPGSTGFTVGPDLTQVKLQALSMVSTWINQNIPQLTRLVTPTAVVSLADSKIIIPGQDQVPSQGPVSVCAGYGYRCCNELTETGQGESVQATDCSNQCFAHCLSRPSLLSFTASPNFDQISRKVLIGPNQQVEFFLVSASESIQNLGIDFGDGERYLGSFAQQPITHTYQCSQAVCTYQVTAQVTDESGELSAQGVNSSLQVEVGQGAY